MIHGSPLRMALLVTSVLVWGSGVSRAESGPTPPPNPEQLKAACSTLAGRVIPAASIGLPSGDASVASATIVAANAVAAPNTPDLSRPPTFLNILGR